MSWTDAMFEASFGGVRIDVQAIEWNGGRVLATHRIPHGKSPVRDMGPEPRVVKCKVAFFETTDPTDDPEDRRRRFQDLVDKSAPATFVHPIDGAWRAYVGECAWSAASEPRDCVMADVTFHEDVDVPVEFTAGPGSTARVGAAEVAADAAQATSAIDDYNAGLVDPGDGLDADLVNESSALASAWEDGADSLGSADVGSQLGQVSVRLQAQIEDLELEDNIDLYPVLVALTLLHHTLKRAADSVVKDSPRTFEITVRAATPLIVIAQRAYGGREAMARFDQLMRLNRIPNPGRVEAGTRLLAMQPSTPAQFGSARAVL